jgi:hypothetical protein
MYILAKNLRFLKFFVKYTILVHFRLYENLGFWKFFFKISCLSSKKSSGMVIPLWYPRIFDPPLSLWISLGRCHPNKVNINNSILFISTYKIESNNKLEYKLNWCTLDSGFVFIKTFKLISESICILETQEIQ